MALSSIDFTRGIRYQEGIGKGEKLGILKGKLEGKIEGKIEGKLEVASNLIKNGIALDIVQQSTGLDMKQIQALLKNKV